MTNRITFFDKACLLPEVPNVGWSKQTSATEYTLKPHVHENAYEIVLVRGGQLQWWVGDDRYTIGPRRLFLTRPGEWHGAVFEQLEPGEISWVQFRFDVENAFGLDREENLALRRSLNETGRVAASTVSIESHFDAMLFEHQSVSGLPWLVKAHALCLMSEAVTALATGLDDVSDPRVQRAKAIMTEDLSISVRSWQIAAHLGVSESWLKQLFVRDTGLTMADWLQQERIHRARELLVSTANSITDIAFEVGFSSSQYFATVFKDIVGTTPTQFRKSLTSTKLQNTAQNIQG